MILVSDSKGRPMQGRRVDFEIVQGDGKLSVESALTDASGRASTVLTLGDQTGSVKVKATVFGHEESVVFTVTALKPPPGSISIVRGNGQEGLPGERLSQPLRVVVKDGRGQVVEGTVVTFEVVEGAGVLSMGQATTSSEGLAGTWLRFGDTSGTVRVRAMVSGVASGVTFTGTALTSDTVIDQAAVKVGGESPFRYQSMSEDQITFVIDGPAPDIQVGDILVNTTEPYFLKKVVRVVRQSPTELVVETTPASLSEVVKEASIKVSFSTFQRARPPRMIEKTFSLEMVKSVTPLKCCVLSFLISQYSTKFTNRSGLDLFKGPWVMKEKR